MKKVVGEMELWGKRNCWGFADWGAHVLLGRTIERKKGKRGSHKNASPVSNKL